MAEENNTGKSAHGRKAMLVLFVVVVLIATSFSVVGMVTKTSRAEMLSLIGPQWQRYVGAAIDSGTIPDDATPYEVRDWLEGRIDGMSEKALSSYVSPEAAKAVEDNDAMSVSSASEPEAVTGTGKILVLLVEFTGSDEYKGVTYTGPEHNSVPQPSADDNTNYWCEDFNTEHFEKLLFGDDDYNGFTLKNYYEEQSGGVFTVDGFVSAWVQITNHSEWWYGADSKSGGEGSDDLNGPAWRFAIDSALAAYNQYGDEIPWADFDVDGDGFIDSLMVVNAGVDQSAGGPSWAIWAHSWFVNEPIGYELPNGLKVGSYTTEPENEAVGVYAHEYGHQLGLPDEYDWTYTGEAPTGFTSLMASGSWGPGIAPDGRLVLGVKPCHLNIWGKYVLGWENGATAYVDFTGGDRIRSKIDLSQSATTTGAIRAVKIELPMQEVDIGLPAPSTGEYQWYSGYRSDWTDEGDIKFSSYEMTTTSPDRDPVRWRDPRVQRVVRDRELLRLRLRRGLGRRHHLDVPAREVHHGRQPVRREPGQRHHGRIAPLRHRDDGPQRVRGLVDLPQVPHAAGPVHPRGRMGHRRHLRHGLGRGHPVRGPRRRDVDGQVDADRDGRRAARLAGHRGRGRRTAEALLHHGVEELRRVRLDALRELPVHRPHGPRLQHRDVLVPHTRPDDLVPQLPL